MSDTASDAGHIAVNNPNKIFSIGDVWLFQVSGDFECCPMLQSTVFVI